MPRSRPSLDSQPSTTPQRDAEQTQLGSRERYQSLFEHMLEGVSYCRMEFDSAGRPVDWIYVDVNSAFEALTGLRDVVGKRASEVISGILDTNPELLDIYARVTKTSVPEEFEMYVPALERWFCARVFRPETGHFAALFENITERKRAEAASQFALARLRRFIDSNIVGVLVGDAAGNIIEANDYYLRLIGYTRDELELGEVDWRTITPPEWLPKSEQAMRELRQGGTSSPYEKEYVRRDGTRVPVFLTDTLLPGPGEQFAAFVLDIGERDRAQEASLASALPGPGEQFAAFVLDISERKRAEDAVRAASQALEREQLVLRERARVFAALTGFATEINAIHEAVQLWSVLVGAVRAVIPGDVVSLTTLDRASGQYILRAVEGVAGGVVGGVIRPGDGAAGRAIAGRGLVVVDALPREQFAAVVRDVVPTDTLAVLAAPLIREGLVLGAIVVGRAGGASFTPLEREVISILASQTALAVANVHLLQEVSELAIHDPLTGLYNRRHFDAELDHIVARARRAKGERSVAAVMFDLDHFGDFNREHGHQAGDAALRTFAGVVREHVRSADLPARYGGEEFVVILEDCSLESAAELAESIRTSLEQRTIAGPDGERLHATVSAGCAVLDCAEPTKEALLRAADVGLFMAKRAGRNRVVPVSAWPTSSPVELAGVVDSPRSEGLSGNVVAISRPVSRHRRGAVD